MKMLSAIAMVLCLVASVYVEFASRSCGAGLTPTTVGQSFRLKWFNGTPWLTDAEGWGVVAPPGTISLSSGSDLAVSRIVGYSIAAPTFVAAIAPTGQLSLLEIAEGGGDRAVTIVQRPVDRLSQYAARADWVPLGPSDCCYGWFGRVKLVLLLAFFGALVMFVSSSWLPGPRN